MKKNVLLLFATVLLVGSVLLITSSSALLKLTSLFSTMGFWGYFIYVFVLISAVVYAPMTGTPAILIASNVFGPLATGILSVVGWTLGSAIAFILSRRFGIPLLKKVIDIRKIDNLLRKIPEDSLFLFIVILRLTLPIDVVSYMLGLTKSLSFTRYIVATFIGVLWFSFAFAYIGDSVAQGNVRVVIGLSLVSLIVFLVAVYMLYTKNDKQS